MKSQTPAAGIALLHEDKKSASYYIACDCYDAEHSVKMWIEVDKQLVPEIAISFYVNTWTPFWEEGYKRIKIAWLILTTGFYHQEHTLLLNKQSAFNLASILTNKVKELDGE